MVVTIPEFDPVEFLVNRRFPLARLMLNNPGAVKFKSPEEEQARLNSIEAYEKELRALPAAELARLAAAERSKLAEEEDAKRFFNQPSAAADFEHWSRASYWTIDEAVALALGKNPRIVKPDNVKPEVWRSAFARRYMDLHELAKRAVWAKQLWEPSYPSIFLAWAKRMAIEVAPGLIAAVEARGIQISDWKTLYDDSEKLRVDQTQKYDALFEKMKQQYGESIERHKQGYDELLKQREQQYSALVAELNAAPTTEATSAEPSLSTRERESLLKLVIGMAVEQYGFDPKAAKNSATANIATDLATAGVPLDSDTVRKWLREAAELLPPQTE